ncbi:MAG: sigma-70 family RNA polymerase sigma factor [Oscillospiraceae bacterium]|nr:sigma-70 family RNA polymerase sigma factor [Oscillospiraceae bacterium]
MSHLNSRNCTLGASSGQPPDDELILRIAQGVPGALEQLYRQTASAVYGYALSILKDAAAAEDVMQDTFVNVLQSAASYRPCGKAMAWILTITRNLALMRLRRFENKNVSFEEVYHAEDARDHFAQSENRMVLSSVLEKLSDDERQIVMLHAISGLKHREIAEVLGMPQATVISKYNRALGKLRALMGGDDLD